MSSVSLEIINRKKWEAKKRTKNLLPLIHPVQYVLLIYWTGKRRCKDVKICMELIKELQTEAIKCNSLPDIPDNFLVDDSGTIYEGRGWDIASDRTLTYPETFGNRINIAYIGDWLVHRPKRKSMAAAIELIRYGVQREYIEKEYKIVQARDHPIKYKI